MLWIQGQVLLLVQKLYLLSHLSSLHLGNNASQSQNHEAFTTKAISWHGKPISSKPHKMWGNGIEPRLAMIFQPKLPIYEEENQN